MSQKIGIVIIYVRNRIPKFTSSTQNGNFKDFKNLHMSAEAIFKGCLKFARSLFRIG